MLSGLQFEVRVPEAPTAPTRMDVAFFVGFAALRPGAAPPGVLGWLRRNGWARLVGPDATTLPSRPLPVPLESYAAFETLFDPDVRTPSGLRWRSWLAGAVYDFFRQGGARCYVLAVAPPFAAPPDPDAVPGAVEALIPGAGAALDGLSHDLRPEVAVLPFARTAVSNQDRDTWRGVAHCFGLSDASFLCIPDLPWLLGAPPATPEPAPVPVVAQPQFLECAEPSEPLPPVIIRRAPPLPRADATARQLWKAAIHQAATLLGDPRPDLQILAAIPLPEKGSKAEQNPLTALQEERLLDPLEHGGIGSPRIQLGWPWFEGDGTADRPDGLGAPDGLLAGLLARNALLRGTFRSSLDEIPDGVIRLSPAPGRNALYDQVAIPGLNRTYRLAERVCLLAGTPRGLRLVSDSTTADDPIRRQGGTARLMCVVLRELRRAGDQVVFEHSGPATWRRLRDVVSAALSGITAAGGLTGKVPFRVRCDRTTMSQQDLDAGRLVCQVEVSPASTVEHILVTLSVTGGGDVGTLASWGGR